MLLQNRKEKSCPHFCFLIILLEVQGCDFPWLAAREAKPV